MAGSVRRDQWLGTLELLVGLAMFASFLVILLVPGLVRLVTELPWAIGAPRWLPTFGLHPHWVAEARYAPTLMMLGTCAALVVCYRWLQSRGRS